MLDRQERYIAATKRGLISQLRDDLPPASTLERWMQEDEEIEAQQALLELPPADVDDFLTKIAMFKAGDVPSLA